jgi:uncharacterized protein YmfQ (DUF2313 family)
MSAPYSTLTADDYLEAAQALMPRGPAWPRDASTTLAKYTSAIANVAWLAHQSLAELFVTELDPGAANTMLPDWEAAFGITARGTKDDRRANLKAVISDPGGFSLGHYVALAASVGVELDPAMDVIVTAAFTWEIHASHLTPTATRTALEAIITLHNRATCVVTFFYNR